MHASGDFCRLLRLNLLPSLLALEARALLAVEPETNRPQDPDLVVWIRWVVHYLFHEGTVIKKAPVATLVIVVITFLAARWLTETLHSGEVSSLQHIIGTKDADIQMLDDRLALYEKASPQTGISSRSNMHVLNAGPGHTKEGKFAFLLTVRNTGTGPSRGMIPIGKGKISSKPLSKEVIDVEFSKLRRDMDRKARTSTATAEYQPGDTPTLAMVTDYPDEQYQTEVMNGGKRIYLFAILQYKDDDTPPGKWRVTEFCGWGLANVPTAICDTHNRTFLSN